MPVQTIQAEQYLPWPINIQGSGNVNGEKFSLTGTGVIVSFGVYKASLNFSSIPDGFHPSAIATFVVSTCCDAGASARNGGRNMRLRGATSYESHRELSFSEGKLILNGKAIYSDQALSLIVELTGQVNLPEDLIGHSVYVLSVRPQNDRSLKAIGSGSLFRRSGEEIKVQIEARQTITPNPLPDPILNNEFRIATESGELHGNSYSLTLHSVFDTANSMAHVAGL
jgi:hypothetical protein